MRITAYSHRLIARSIPPRWVPTADQINSIIPISVFFSDKAQPISTKRRIHDFFSTSSRSQTLDYPDQYASFTRPQLDQLDFCSIKKYSVRTPQWCRPRQTFPTSLTDRARPVTDCLIGLDRVDRIGSGNKA